MKTLLCLLLLLNLNIFAKDEHHDHDHHHHDEEKTKKSLDAHEHGMSILNIVQDKNNISFEFEMPGFDVVGFEYKAKKKEDIKKVRSALNIMSNYNNMIIISDEAKCKEDVISQMSTFSRYPESEHLKISKSTPKKAAKAFLQLFITKILATFTKDN